MSASPLIPEEMRRQYVSRRVTDLEKLTEALKARQTDAFHRIGHQLKGNASTYGYDELEAIGIRLEQVENFDDSMAEDLLKEFKTWLVAQQNLFKTQNGTDGVKNPA